MPKGELGVEMVEAAQHEAQRYKGLQYLINYKDIAPCDAHCHSGPDSRS